MSDNDSENEDQPRLILDLHGDFTIVGSSPPVVLKLNEISKLRKEMISPGHIWAIHPVPDYRAIMHAKEVMGNGKDGVWTGTLFQTPAGLTPDLVFAVRSVNTIGNRTFQRFCVRRRYAPSVTGLKTMAIYIDGACRDDNDNSNSLGTAAARGGYGFVFNQNPEGTQSRALEKRGPTGEATPIGTHNVRRAELRAAVAALAFRVWHAEGWDRVVLVTDSDYVAHGATAWLRNWAAAAATVGGNENDNNEKRRGCWQTAAGRPVANRDLWEQLLGLLGAFAEGGCEVSFWMVPRRYNKQADLAAKAACLLDADEDYENPTGALM